MKKIHHFIVLLCIFGYSAIAQTKYLREKEEIDVKRKKGSRTTKSPRKMLLSTPNIHASVYSLSSIFHLFSRKAGHADSGAMDVDNLPHAEDVATGKGDYDKRKESDYQQTTDKTADKNKK